MEKKKHQSDRYITTNSVKRNIHGKQSASDSMSYLKAFFLSLSLSLPNSPIVQLDLGPHFALECVWTGDVM